MGFDLYKITEEEKEYAAFKAQQHHNEIEHLYNLSLQFITEMLLCNKLQIQDVPVELRLSYRTLYLSAFRASSQISSQRFMEDIVLLYDDLKRDFENKQNYKEMLLSHLDHYDIGGDSQFEHIKKTITKEILSQLYDSKP
ncbi:hypothetical protein [Candidatus Pseudoruminococcus sp.]|uniref:hypothetical protein n=1 Tax=Candidatus Pseudoruminococcus sp. TaxID=3101048 RepID=UPI00399B0270